MKDETGYWPLLIDGIKILESKRVDLTAIDGYEIPIDPAEDTQCDSCQ